MKQDITSFRSAGKAFALLCLVMFATQVSAQVSVPSGTTSILNQPYVAGGTARQVLDLYIPSGSSPTPRPLVLYIHGGGWNTGSKDTIRSPNAPVVADLLARGFIVASMNYRYTTATPSAAFAPADLTPFPAQVNDAKSAVRWLRANAGTYNIDSNRIGAWGQSAGGHVALMLGLTSPSAGFDVGQNLAFSSRVQAVATYFPPSDLSLYGSSSTTTTDPSYPLTLYLNGRIQDNPAALAISKPVTYATPDDPNFLIVHGTADTTVPLSHSQNLLAGLQSAGVTASLITVPGQGHSFVGFDNYAVDFFATQIPEPTTGGMIAVVGLAALLRRRRKILRDFRPV